MFTVVAYSASIAQDVLTYLTPVQDQHVRVEGNNIIVPDEMSNLLAAIGIGGNISQVRIETPSLRRSVLLDLPSVNVSTTPIYPLRWYHRFRNPIPLDASEPMRVLVKQSSAGNQQETVVLFLGDGPQGTVTGDMFTVKATASQTLAPYEWTSAPLTFDQTLPAGRYQVVGFRAQSAGLLAARLIFVGQSWRPGCIGVGSIAVSGDDIFRYGNLGVWGEFPHDQPPTVEFLSTSADTSEIVYFDLIKVA